MTGWVLARSAVASPANSHCCHFFACEFCLLGALWILGGVFSAVLLIFPFWVSSSSAPLGTRGRRQVWRGWCDLLATLLLSEHGFSCGGSPVLGLSWVLALGGVNSPWPSFIAVNDLGCQWVPLFQPLLCSFFWCFCTHLHSFILHISQYFCISVTTSTSLQCLWVTNCECYHWWQGNLVITPVKRPLFHSSHSPRNNLGSVGCFPDLPVSLSRVKLCKLYLWHFVKIVFLS